MFNVSADLINIDQFRLVYKLKDFSALYPGRKNYKKPTKIPTEYPKSHSEYDTYKIRISCTFKTRILHISTFIYHHSIKCVYKMLRI